MELNWLEWLGYLASLIVLISLLMSSILKLRWINLVGSSLFALYGFLLGALPVGLMNLGIAFINIYYLVKIYNSKEFFKILPIEGNSEYFRQFLQFYKNGIEQISNKTDFDINKHEESFYILRNMKPAGVFIGSKYNEDTLKVDLDFVIPEYRDFKIGNYIYDEKKDYFLERGYTTLVAFTSNEAHVKYFNKMGFSETLVDGKKCYAKALK